MLVRYGGALRQRKVSQVNNNAVIFGNSTLEISELGEEAGGNVSEEGGEWGIPKKASCKKRRETSQLNLEEEVWSQL